MSTKFTKEDIKKSGISTWKSIYIVIKKGKLKMQWKINIYLLECWKLKTDNSKYWWEYRTIETLIHW